MRVAPCHRGPRTRRGGGAMKWALGIVVAFLGAAAQEWRWFAWPVMGTLAVCGATIWLAGCAHPARLTPCLDRVTLDAHHVSGTLRGDDSARALAAGERDRVDSNHTGFEVGGSLEFAIGYAPDECRAYGGEKP